MTRFATAAAACAALLTVLLTGAATALSDAARPEPAAVLRADAVPTGDTSWGGACELPLCKPLT